MVIDGHAHVYPDSSAKRIVEAFVSMHRMEPREGLGMGTIGDLQERMAENGIDYTVLANFAPVKSVEKTNIWTLRLAKEFSNIIPLVSVYPGMSIDTVAGYFAQGAKGIKMHNGIQGFDPDDEGLREIYAYCSEHRIPVTFHCGETSRVHMNEYTDMTHILPVVQKYTDIPFVLTHLAASRPDMVLHIAANFSNVLFDTSIAFSGRHCIHRIHHPVWENDEEAAALFRKAGCEKFAFGSDYPFGHPGSDIERIRRLPLSEEEKKGMLGLNTYRLYFGR